MISLEFVVELEALSHPARQQRIAEMGRDARNAPLWDELERGNSYQRRIALQSCATSRDGARALRMIGDASRLARGLALEMIALAGDDAQIALVWPLLNRNQTRRLVKKLVKRRRRDAVDALLEARFALGDIDEALVAFASSEVAARLLERGFERASAPDFVRIARLQPRVALQKALEIARGLQTPDGVALAKCNAVLGGAWSFRAETEVSLALELVRELNRVFALQKIDLGALVNFGQAQKVAELVLASGEKVRFDFSSRAQKLKPETLLALVQNGHINSNWATVLKRLAPPLRAPLYERFGVGWRGQGGVLSPDIVALLPRQIRHAEARRHLELPALRAKPTSWLPYAAFLGAEDARDAVKPFLGDPDPDFRGAALATIVQNVRFERQSAGDILNLIGQRANEQDPVRGVMLDELADLPPTLWAENQLPALAKIQRQALDARDLSYGTASHLERLAVALLPHFPEWAGAQLAELLKERGHVSFFDLQDRVNDAQMQIIGPRLEPIFRAWADRERAPFLSAMQAFGKRLKVWDGGADLLINFLKNGPTHLQPSAAQILARFRPDLWRDIAPQLLEKDESWGTQAVVYNFLHLKRQDLLSPALLGRARPKGRFLTGKTRFVLPFQRGFERWTPDQQATFELTLREVTTDKSRDNYGIFGAINALAQLPDIAPGRLLELARLSHPKPAEREAALRVLSRLDGGQGVPTLLESLDDERARIAIYGLRRALLEMPATRALEILRAVPLQKVTVAKEVLRLLGELEAPAAFDFLLELGARDLHRDARVALLRALWDHLEDPRVWPLLQSAAASEDAALATMAARTTAPRLSRAARASLNTLLAQLLLHPESRVRLQVLENGAIGALSDPQTILLAPMLRCLESEVAEEYQSAAGAIWQTYASDHPAAIADAMRRVLPRRRALREILSVLENDIAAPRHSAAASRAILEVLADDPLTLPLHLQLALHTLDAAGFGALVEKLVANDALHAENFVALCRSLENLYFSPRSRDSDADAALQNGWRNAGSPSLRRLSLALLKSDARDAQGWTNERRAQLEAFRADPAPLVAGAAQFTFWDDGHDGGEEMDEEDDFDFEADEF